MAANRSSSKYQDVKNVYAQSVDKIVESFDSWISFLRFASTHTEIPFINQAVVYAQRPLAGKVMTFDDWKNIFDLRITRGTKGIPVFNPVEQGKVLHYFEESDTVENFFAVPLTDWSAVAEMEAELADALQDEFGLSFSSPIGAPAKEPTLADTVVAAVDAQLDGIMADVASRVALTNVGVEESLRHLVRSSALYVCMRRLNLDYRELLSVSDFASIDQLNSLRLTGTIGVGINKAAAAIISPVEDLLREHQLAQARDGFFVETDQRTYNESRNSDAPIITIKGDDHVRDNASTRDNANAGLLGVESGFVWPGEAEVPSGPQGSGVLRHDDGGDARGSSEGDRAESGRPVPGAVREDAEGGAFPRAEEGELLGVRGAVEQHSGPSTGDGDARGSVSVEVEDAEAPARARASVEASSPEVIENKAPSVAEPVGKAEQSSFFEIDDSFASSFEGSMTRREELIRDELLHGSSFANGKFRIFEQFEKNEGSASNAAFLRKEYGIGGVWTARRHQDHDGKGLTIWDDEDPSAQEIFLSWSQVAVEIGKLVEQGVYLSADELERYPVWLEDKAERETDAATEEKAEEAAELVADETVAAEVGDDGPEKEEGLSVGAAEAAREEAADALEAADELEGVPEQSLAPEDRDRIVRDELLRGTRHQYGKFRVFAQFEKGESPAKNAAFLKELYGEGAVYGANRRQNHDAEGMEIWDTTSDSEVSVRLTWREVAVEISKLIKEGAYLPPSELEHYRAWAQAQASPQQPRDFDLRARGAVEAGKPRERVRANIEAIRVLKMLEAQGRLATEEEQDVLSRYVGWGGLADVFDEAKMPAEYAELKSLLTDEEYAAACESTLTAFYTPNFVVSAVYDALENMGFAGGRILEPSCGTGRFIGMLPESMKDSRVFGVELDSVSGKIASQLYQTRNVLVKGYEKTQFEDNSFDVAVSNVPFGQFKVSDPRYNRLNMLIHDYFFAKTLDKVRPGGIVAFITSKGTMDKENSSARRYIAQRAKLLGAIRLPDNTFKAEAGTEVTSDILFLQKRDEPVPEPEDAWIKLDDLHVTDPATGEVISSVRVNKYFADHPSMVLGDMVMQSGRFGLESACKARPDASLEESLKQAVDRIYGIYEPVELSEELGEVEANKILADPDVRNFSYTMIEDKVFYREGEFMRPSEVKPKDVARMRGLIEVRDAARDLIALQMADADDELVETEQRVLNGVYDRFTSKFGYLNSKANKQLFKQDASSPLLCALEDEVDDGVFEKAPIFTTRTIKPAETLEHVDNAQDALTVCFADLGRVDFEYMTELSGLEQEQLVEDLRGDIFRVPGFSTYVLASEYLSGNVREKLAAARRALEDGDVDLAANVAALEKVIPEDIPAHEITANLGATWIPVEYVRDFIYELLQTPSFHRVTSYHTWGRDDEIDVSYSPVTATWGISNKGKDSDNVRASNVFGTSDASAYQLIEDALNLRDTIIRKKVWDPYTYEDKTIVDKEATVLAQSKQNEIREQFREWVFKDEGRREFLVGLYNEKFNSIVPRQFDGSSLKLSGINTEIKLKDHQLDVIARQLFGGNTLLYHVVGAGKTFSMVAAAQEGKRLGLHSKSMFVVPNHLTEQTGNEYLRLYPNANILVATKQDFTTANRKRFCSRIATGDWDAVIIGHSQFEKIPMSHEYQMKSLEKQKEDIISFLEQAKMETGKGWSVKEAERVKKSVEARIEKLNKQERKDDVVTFEELGVDKLFVDEAHYYKNLYVVTKMRNVAGVQTTEAQKSSDLFMKTRWLDEMTGGTGVVFATGTAVSNSMTELYTMQRYLQYGELERMNLEMFDAWASTFGEKVTAIELLPEGGGYRTRDRFAKFHNLPELMTVFKEVADIQTADMLDLPVPKSTTVNVRTQASMHQAEMISELGERADRIRNASVDPTEDNMLKITGEGRKLALDQRLMNPGLPDDPESKVSVAAGNVFDIWQRGIEDRTTQLVFCDISTPTGSGAGAFNVYDDMKRKLVEKGVPENEIAFIHDAKDEVERERLFDEVRRGNVRVLLGSTFKMGAGTNVQDRLIAIHNLDCPWRPADLEQRAGRIVRQGNMNEEVEIFRYVTEGTFDSYLYQTVENKQRFISQVFTSKDPVRSAEDIDEAVLDYAEVKALASGNPLIKEKMEIENKLPRLRMLKKSHMGQQFELETNLNGKWPRRIAFLEKWIEAAEVDAKTAAAHPVIGEDFSIVIEGKLYDKRVDAASALYHATKKIAGIKPVPIGSFRGFELLAVMNTLGKYDYVLKGQGQYPVATRGSFEGDITRMINVLDGLPEEIERSKAEIDELGVQMTNAREQLGVPFAHEEELATLTARLAELDTTLNLDERTVVAMGDEKDVENALGGGLEFDRQQTAQINKALKAGMAPELIRLFGQPEYDWRRMETIRKELEAGTDPDELAKYLDKENPIDTYLLGQVAELIRRGVDPAPILAEGIDWQARGVRFRALKAGINLDKLLEMKVGNDAIGFVADEKFNYGKNDGPDLTPYVHSRSTRSILAQVAKALEEGLPQDIVEYVAEDGAAGVSMREIAECVREHGMGLDKIKLFTKHNVGYYQSGIIRKALIEGMPIADAEVLANPEFIHAQVEILKSCFDAGLDARAIADPNLKPAVMKVLASALEAGIDLDALTGRGFDAEQMREVLDGMKAGIDTSVYADPKFSARQMEVIRHGLEAGVDVERFATDLMAPYEMKQILQELLDEQDQSGTRSGADALSLATAASADMSLREADMPESGKGAR